MPKPLEEPEFQWLEDGIKNLAGFAAWVIVSFIAAIIGVVLSIFGDNQSREE